MSLSVFLSTLLDGKADRITSRKEEGKEYFNNQAERAGRVASNQLETRRENRRQLLQTANTLKHTANMPAHIVRGLVSAGPEALQAAFTLYQGVPTHDWSASDWESVYETSNFYAQEYDEDLPTFIKRTVGLIGDNYRATEQTGGDLQSAFAASALGYNAKDKARRDLSDTEVAMGFTAQDLLDMESRPGWQSDPNSTYAGQVPSATQGISGMNQPPLPAKEQLEWRNQFRNLENEYVDRLAMERFSQQQDAMDRGETDRVPSMDVIKADPSLRQEARLQAAQEFANIVGPEVASGLNFFQPIMQEFEQIVQREESQRVADDAVRGIESVRGQTPMGTEMPVSEPPVDSQRAPPAPGSQEAMTQKAQEMFAPRPNPDEPYWAEGQGNLFSRGMEKMKQFLGGTGRGGSDPSVPVDPASPAQSDMNRGLNVLEPRQSIDYSRPSPSVDMSAGTPPSNPPAASTPRDTFDASIPQGWTPAEGGRLQTPDGRLVTPIGIDPGTLNWIYKDLQTGEEFIAPN